MKIIVDNQLRLQGAPQNLKKTIKADLTVKNPQWVRNGYLGYSRRNIPEFLYFYEEDGDDMILPFGYCKQLNKLVNKHWEIYSSWEVLIKNYEEPLTKIYNNIVLYDYQGEAATAVLRAKNGVLVMPAGAGKTQTGLKVACEIGHKTLWITHTKDLLNQSYTRAKENGITGLGKITDGKVQIGENMTFATVQTLSKLDLTKYKDTWGTIIVDECHRVCGTPAAVTMFYKCISSLSARYKIGLTATPERKEKGTEKAMFALLGEIITEVPKTAVKKLHAQIKVVKTGYSMGEECEKSDGTVDYTKAVDYLGKDDARNELIIDILKDQLDDGEKHYCLILGDRVSHLEALQEALGYGAVIHGKTNKNVRDGKLEAIKRGRVHYLFATYALAKEGLDIPRLDRLFLISPHDDKAVIVQSVGRIERCFEGKAQPIVYDFVDEGDYFTKKWKKRKSIYKKNGNEVIE